MQEVRVECVNPFVTLEVFLDVDVVFIFSRRLGGGGGVFETLRISSEEDAAALDRLVILGLVAMMFVALVGG